MKVNNSLVIVGLFIILLGVVVGLLFWIISKVSNKMSDKDIINTTVDNFMLLAKVPRPTHHEEKISNYLVEWVKEQGLVPVQDDVYNVMFDVPATKGMEKKPMGILQVHMDMVVAVADGKEFDPLADPITVIRDDKKGILKADGTSLGGDDGAGVAMVMAIAQGKMKHGPLRMIITVNEEDGMLGALNIDASWFDGASFLINIDNEWSNQVLVSTAAGDYVNVDEKISFIASTGNTTLDIELSNLKGGHSGVEIDKGRLNGIIGLANLLKQIDVEGIHYELASFEGGTAANAIPTKARTRIVIKASDKEKVEKIINSYCNEITQRYKDVEDAIKCFETVVDEVPQVVYNDVKGNIIHYITEVVDGVYTMSKDMKDLVESSSNLGVVKLNSEGLVMASLIRSSSPEKEEEIIDSEIGLAKRCKLNAITKKSSDAWPYDPNSKLLELAKKVYKENNQEDIEVAAVHAGLECGTFKKLKPDLDMISIGPDLKDGHTIHETLYLNSIPKVWKLLEGIL